jgi:hypothetical protein
MQNATSSLLLGGSCFLGCGVLGPSEVSRLAAACCVAVACCRSRLVCRDLWDIRFRQLAAGGVWALIVFAKSITLMQLHLTCSLLFVWLIAYKGEHNNKRCL